MPTCLRLGFAALFLLVIPLSAQASSHRFSDRVRVINTTLEALDSLAVQPGVDQAKVAGVRTVVANMSPKDVFTREDLARLEQAQMVLADYGRTNVALEHSVAYLKANGEMTKAVAWLHHVVDEHGGHLERG